MVLAFLIASVVRVAQGSATVSMVTAAGLVAPIVEAGSYSASHVNDSGFWLVSRYLGMTEKQTFRVWTVMETIVGVTGFAVVLVLSLVF